MNILNEQHTILKKYLADLRDVEKQKDRSKFRQNLYRIGQIVGYEISKTLEYQSVEVETPLGIDSTHVPSDQIVVGTILRAGLPLHEGILSVFDEAESTFIAAYRQHHKDGTFEINMQYLTCPSLEGKVVILADTMLATGASLDLSIQHLKQYGTPKHIHAVSAIASKNGLEYFKRCYPDITVWTCAVDEELTAKSLIVPGMGDAGDLAYGEKIQG